jgi:hypothetical protein
MNPRKFWHSIAEGIEEGIGMASNPNTGAIVKIALIGGAAYLLYRYLENSGMLDTLMGKTPALPPAQPLVTVNAPVPPVQVQKPPDAALKAMGESRSNIQTQPVSWQSWKMTADEWNWYREQATGAATTVDLFPAGNRGALMTAAQYHDARAAAGLAGLGYFPYEDAYMEIWTV